ncbi:hypothetical protein MJO28_001885 [Puccinia striiformis f. sp. tritici]|uniref:Uncharacterized protein n=1 Tax=Puccinia striiformis f. sp. tritici TaxID=168172 RepID=A0ACC0EVW9_9BASI|nr:hypothetical protein MJO28_001885 [Puccinia striiformis f. sp. tritici]
MLVTLRKSTFFCFVCFVLGPCQFTLSSLDGEAHAAQEALSRFPGLTRLDSSNSITVNVPGSHMKDRLDPKHYGAIPQKLAQRKAELKSMEIEDRAIKDSIIYMSGLQFDDMKMRLVELHNALKVYVEARVFRLSGKGSAFTGLLPKTNLEGPKYAPTLVPLHSSASSHGSRTTQFPKEEPSPETGSQRRKSARKSKIIELIGNTLPFDKFSSRIIAHQENHGGVSTTGQTGVQDSLGGSGTQLGKMVMHSGRVRGELAGDELSIVRRHMDDESIRIWNSVEERLAEFGSGSTRIATPSEGEFIADFLRTYYLLGDYVYTHGLLPANVIAKMKLFNFPTLADRINLYIRALCRAHDYYFDEASSVIPQMEFLTTGRSVAHFHRSLKALHPKYHSAIVYLAVRATINAAPLELSQGLSRGSFSWLCAGFVQLTFFNRAEHLSSALMRTPDMDHRGTIKSHSVVDLIRELTKFFHEPLVRELSDEVRVEFQIVFYMLDFIDRYLQPIIKTMIDREQIPTIFPKQMQYMRSYLRFFHKQYENPAGFKYSIKDTAFIKMGQGRSSKNASLRQWIRDVPLILFPHVGWRDRLGLQRSPNIKYNLWMCETQ